MSSLAEDALALVAEHTALYWPVHAAQHVWFRARGACKQLRSRYKGIAVSRGWQGSLQLATTSLETHASMRLVVVRDPAALDRAINALAFAPRWLRLRRDVHLALPCSVNESHTSYQLEEAGAKEADLVAWPVRWPTAIHARAMAMQLLRALSERSLPLRARSGDKPVDIYCCTLFPRQPTSPAEAQSPWPSATDFQCGDLLGVLGRVMEAVDELIITVLGCADPDHRALSSNWIHAVCLALQRRTSRRLTGISLFGSAWLDQDSAHGRRVAALTRALQAGAHMRRCAVIVVVHGDHDETVLREFPGLDET